MAQTNIDIRMDGDAKQQFDQLCSELELDMTIVFTFFEKAMVRQQKTPCAEAIDTPNAEALTVIDDDKNSLIKCCLF